jgi:hypothetical protein
MAETKPLFTKEDALPVATTPVPTDKFEALMAKVAQLEEKLANKGIRRPQRVNEHIAKLREWDNALILGWKTSPKEVTTKDGESELQWTVVDHKGTELVIPYLRFLNEATPVQVKILDQKAVVDEKLVETNLKRDAQHGDQPTGEMIDYTVTSVSYIVKVEVLEGKLKGETFVLPQNNLLNT